MTPTDMTRRRQAVIGLAALTHDAYAGVDLKPIWDRLVERVGADPYDAGALLDISNLLLLTGQRTEGLEAQARALALNQVYERVGQCGGLRLLTFVKAGDFMANTPLDFLLKDTKATLIQIYVDGAMPLPPIPDHDVAIVAIGEADDSHAVLASLDAVLETWPRPVLNRKVHVIIDLSRSAVSDLFAQSERVISPKTLRLPRQTLVAIATGKADLDPALSWPILVRPVGSHAGNNLEKITDPSALMTYLRGFTHSQAYVASFVDYASADGQFRKYRIALIGKRPYLCHLAISNHWMVHYLNAGMSDSQAKRDEEAQAMAHFDEAFALRHKAALDELCNQIDLDYFAIDCAETPDGKLLLFEADAAMIIHAMGEPDLFAYKRTQMKALFGAFQALLERAVSY
jgi:hypothetical protein